MWKHRIIWLEIWIISLIIISFYGGVVSYLFFYCVTLIPVISILYLGFVFARFRIYQQVVAKNVTTDEKIPYQFVLQNEDFVVYTSIGVRLFEDFSYVEQLPGQSEYRLFPGERVQFDTNLICKYRGEYKVGIEKIIITDFFKLFRFVYKVPFYMKATVRPKIVSLQQLAGIPDIQVIIEQENVYEKTEPDVLTREYIQGDSLKRINWKVSAREKALKTRLYTGAQKNDISILLDLQRLDDAEKIYLPKENKVLEVAIALLHFFSSRNIGVHIFYQNPQLMERHVTNMGQFEIVYEELSAVPFEINKNFCNLLEEFQVMSQANIIMWVVARIDNDIFTRAMEASDGGKLVVLYVITENDIQEYMAQTNMRLIIVQVGMEQRLEDIM